MLAGITIAALGGENGLIARVKQSKESYSIAETKEKLELEITNLRIEQEGKGEELKKEDLPKMKSDEIDVRDTTNFPVEVICGGYKFEIDENFNVKYIGTANETVVTYTTDPAGYTNTNRIKILIKISNTKGIKSVQKPGETDKLLAQGRTTVGLDYEVNKNGNYIFKIVDMENNEIEKNIFIDLIDTLAPEDFTPEVEKDENSITIKENGKDADATEESSKSGIDYYEYYLTDEKGNTTKYDSNKIEDLDLGTYKIYLIAYDKAGNSKKSNNISFKISRQYTKVAGGLSHTLAIDSEGNLWAWGDNRYGQLGDGTITDKIVPMQIKQGTKFKEISAGNFYSLAIDSEGNLWTWGSNDSGRLGDGTTTQRISPVQIKSGTKFKEISAGIEHSLAIDSEGNLWAWGNNMYGQLGDGTTTQKISPVQIKSGTKFTQISGANHSLAIDEEGNLWTWGWNAYGQLGDGTKEDKTLPMQITNGIKFVKIAAGNISNGAIDEEGNLWTWGTNIHGQLGDGTNVDKLIPTQVLKNIKFSSIVSGVNSFSAIDIYQNMWSWGYNEEGNVGDGTTTNRSEPIIIKTKIKEIFRGSIHSFAIDIGKNLWAWGWNAYGQLGDGTTTSRLVPTEM